MLVALLPDYMASHPIPDDIAFHDLKKAIFYTIVGLEPAIDELQK
jgi:hypothetical protein